MPKRKKPKFVGVSLDMNKRWGPILTINHPGVSVGVSRDERRLTITMPVSMSIRRLDLVNGSYLIEGFANITQGTITNA